MRPAAAISGPTEEERAQRRAWALEKRRKVGRSMGSCTGPPA
jgi:hypothetical protein